MILILIFALLFISLVLIVLGRRGRKINDHPQCTWCGFDLDGVYPIGVTCPECGAGLKRAGAIRQGVRKKMPALVWLGGLLAVLPLIALAAAMYAVLSGGGMYRQLPTGLLMRSVAFGSGANSGPIADELMNRLTNQAEPMSAQEKQELKDLILRVQADSAFAWSEAWGDLFESLYRSGDASKSDYSQFLKQAIRLSIQTRPSVELKGEMPIALVVSPMRVGSATDQSMYVRFRKARLNGKESSLHSLSSPFGNLANMLVGKQDRMGQQHVPIMVNIAGSAATRRGWRYDLSNAGWVVDMPADATVGPATLELELMLHAQDDAQNMMMQIAVEQQSGIKKREEVTIKPPDLVVSASFQIVEAEATSLEARKLSESDLAALRSALQPREIAVTTSVVDRRVGVLPLADSEWTSASMTVDVSGTKQPLAYEVLLRYGERMQSLGDLISGRRAWPYPAWYSANSQQYLQAQLRGFDPAAHTKATVILRPRRKQALRTLDMAAFVNHELVYENVPIRHDRMDMRQRTTPQRRTTTTPKTDDSSDTPAKPEPESKP